MVYRVSLCVVVVVVISLDLTEHISKYFT